MRGISIPIVLTCAGTVVVAQQPARPTFRTSTRLIVQTVNVTDKTGAPIEGLTAEDFVLTENGQPQQIAFVDYQSMTTAPLPPLDASVVPAPSVTVASTTTARISEARYENKRLIVLYFDLLNMGFFDELRMYDNAMQFVATRMTSADMVAVMVFEQSSVRLVEDFTDDRARLASLIQALVAAATERNEGGGAVETGSAFGQNNDAFNIFATDRQLAALQTAVTELGPLPQPKTLVYLGSGLRLNGADNMAQLRATVNAAVRSNVTINPIDTRGLVATAPMGDATRPSPGGVGMFSGVIAQAATTRQQRSQDTYYALAKDTGGRALFDNNDLSLGIERAAHAVTGYYTIGYYSSHGNRDGRFRRVKVALAEGRSAELAYRSGYYGDKDFSKFSRGDKERQLEEALRLEDPITDIPMAIEVNYFQVSSAEYFVPVSVRMPAGALAQVRPNGSIDAEIDMIGEIKDEHAVTQRNVRDRVRFTVDRATAPQLSSQMIQYELGFTVLPGKYTIKLLARDATTGRIGTFLTGFEVPNLEQERSQLPISTVILSNQRQPFAQALQTVRQKIAADTANPLVHDGQKLIPSVTRTFSPRWPLFVFLQAYQRGNPSRKPLVAFVSFYLDGVKVFETALLTPRDGWNPATGTVAIRFTIPLAGLTAGAYDCQVTVLDPEAKRAAFWRAPITVTPE